MCVCVCVCVCVDNTVHRFKYLNVKRRKIDWLRENVCVHQGRLQHNL